jgi:hypothetical protein
MSSLKFLNMCQLKKGVGMSYITTPSNTLSLQYIPACLSMFKCLLATPTVITNFLDERTDCRVRGDKDKCTGKPGAQDLCVL